MIWLELTSTNNDPACCGKLDAVVKLEDMSLAGLSIHLIFDMCCVCLCVICTVCYVCEVCCMCFEMCFVFV